MSTETNGGTMIGLEPSDEDLMLAIQQGDSSALNILINRYRKLLKCAIIRTVHDDADAEDVLAIVMHDLWRKACNYSPAKGKPLAWLMTLCRRQAIDQLRRKVAYTRAQQRMEEELKQTSPTTEKEEFTSSNEFSHILTLVALIPESQAEVITLCYIKGYTQREAAKATNASLGTVKTRLELGLKKLRKKVKLHQYKSRCE